MQRFILPVLLIECKEIKTSISFFYLIFLGITNSSSSGADPPIFYLHFNDYNVNERLVYLYPNFKHLIFNNN